MTRSALCGALWLALLFPGYDLLQAQTASLAGIPAELPDAPQPRQMLPPCVGEMTGEPSAESEPSIAIATVNVPSENLEIAARAAIAASDAQPLQMPENQAPANQDRQNQRNNTRPGFPPVSPPASGRAPIPLASRAGIPHRLVDCIPGTSNPAERFVNCNPRINMYERFLNSVQPLPLTPKQKFLLAYRNIRDPFNLMTIAGEAGISVASDSHSAYGPGFPGFGKYAGVSLTQDITAEFLGTFLIPSLAHQDPHYHRMPNLSVQRRIIHVFDAVVIGQGDEGRPMFNYAEVFGTIGTSAIGNIYVPGREKSWGASATRVSVALATDPIGNAITEFLPDVARHININVVLVQRVINRVAIEEGSGGVP